ncbi:MAG: hypothetical protein GY940_46525 [bacterium]|nr:hypothetical protein [bacterium]
MKSPSLPGYLFYLLIMLTGFSYTGSAQHLTITKIAEWGSGEYRDVIVKGNYAYCTALEGGLDIIDIRDNTNPRRVGNYNTPGRAQRVSISGHYAYVADGSRGLLVLDISNPIAPTAVATYGTTQDTNNIFLSSNYAYMTDSFQGVQILDVSNPLAPSYISEYGASDILGIKETGNYVYLVSSPGLTVLNTTNPPFPKLASRYETPGTAMGIDIRNPLVYIADSSEGLLILDASNPNSPTLKGSIKTTRPAREVFIDNNYAYVAGEGGIEVVDVSDPTTPSLIGDYPSGSPKGIFAAGSIVYAADSFNGLKLIDFSTPASPTLTGNYNASGTAKGVTGNGNYIYLAHGNSGLQVIDISNPSSPKPAGNVDTPGQANAVYLSGDWAYVADGDEGLQLIDISNPANPKLTGTYKTLSAAEQVFVSGTHAYIAQGEEGVAIVDISAPSAPVPVGNFDTDGTANGIWIDGSLAYVADGGGGLQVLDVSDPANPTLKGNFSGLLYPVDVYIKDNTAYVADSYEGLKIVDISDPSSPLLTGFYTTSGWAVGVQVDGQYAYVADDSGGVAVIDVSNPNSPTLEGAYNTSGRVYDVYVNGNYAYVADGESGRLMVLQLDFPGSAAPPRIGLNRTQLYFASDNAGATTGTQPVLVTNSGGGTLNWTASIDQDWLSCSPTSGINSGDVFLSINTTGISTGTYTGTLTFTSTQADNSPQTVNITLNVYPPGQTSPPFGDYATPIDGSTVSGSVPFTGWVLDDIGAKGVKLSRETDDGSLVYIGDAVFVEGARPDVEQAFPGYPGSTGAGWGYMMLTNFLPGGNGVFTIHAVATDAEGNRVTLGTKTITVDNANATKPFGAIDTPLQGGTASGINYVNYGWALTPLPNTIPVDGSTIRVWVDGVPGKHPVYNRFRNDIATAFPGYNNSAGAVGYVYLDTTQYTDGIHTIQWTVTDDAGNSDGIGSRYFSIRNTDGDMEHTSQASGRFVIPSAIETDVSRPVGIKTGYRRDGLPMQVYPDKKGVVTVEMKELERLEIHFNSSHVNPITSLPIGSTLDSEKGVFYWQAGPGFVGVYRFDFLVSDNSTLDKGTRKQIAVKILPR